MPKNVKMMRMVQSSSESSDDGTTQPASRGRNTIDDDDSEYSDGDAPTQIVNKPRSTGKQLPISQKKMIARRESLESEDSEEDEEEDELEVDPAPTRTITKTGRRPGNEPPAFSSSDNDSSEEYPVKAEQVAQNSKQLRTKEPSESSEGEEIVGGDLAALSKRPVASRRSASSGSSSSSPVADRNGNAGSPMSENDEEDCEGDDDEGPFQKLKLRTLPSGLRDLRACMVCSLIKTSDQFERDGCDNCDGVLKLKNSRENVECCTSKNFQGFIGMATPSTSWVARWQRLDKPLCAPGVYATSVTGTLPREIIDDLKSFKGKEGFTYNRDRSNLY